MLILLTLITTNVILALIYFRLYDIYQAIEYKGTFLDDNWLDKKTKTYTFRVGNAKPKGKKRKDT